MIIIKGTRRITAKCEACGFGIFVEDHPQKVPLRKVIDGFIEHDWSEISPGIFLCPECKDEEGGEPTA